MDTTFFAVDSAGHVALFETGEDGHAPDGDANDVRDQLWDLLKPPDADDEDGWITENVCKTVGLYFFDYDEEAIIPISLYLRVYVPEMPLHVDQLPPDLRESCRIVEFDLRFDQVERVQPLEHMPCVYWYEDRQAYLCADGKTVKPIPGKEHLFAGFVREFHADLPEEAKKLIFDGPTE
jgi:hypothetical protein